ncbi:MAG: non-hydrolyzing UDP-N-acetylglucosamine 2-epimerase [Bacillota bacterium]
MFVFGTRPEAIKLAPLIKKMKKRDEFEVLVTVTAQHREMLDQVLELFSIKVDYDLNIMKERQSLAGITSRVLNGLEDIHKKEDLDMILVHGDTTTTFVGALSAFYNKIKIGHVEAGLRTNNKYSPFPEEMNRHLTGVLTDLHFTPTSSSYKNLLKENINKDKIFKTGNTVIDALYETRDDNFNFYQKELKKIDFENKKVILLTSHRRENLGIAMENIFKAVKKIILENKDTELVFPVHLNPAVREKANKILAGMNRVHLIEPLDYKPFVNLMARSYLILTDSGGIQEEAPALGKAVLVLRETTERPEAIEAGTVKLVGTDEKEIFEKANKLINDEKFYKEMAESINPYGDGKASERIIQRLLYEFDYSKDPGEEFDL